MYMYVHDVSTYEHTHIYKNCVYTYLYTCTHVCMYILRYIIYGYIHMFYICKYIINLYWITLLPCRKQSTVSGDIFY